MDLDELRHRPLVFVEDLDRPLLSDQDVHHFQRVLRVKGGALITLGDGNGRWRTAEFGPKPKPVSAIEAEAATSDRVAVGFVPVKGTRPEWVVKKLTELGVDDIVPVISQRCVVHWDGDRLLKQMQRMTITAREACLQARRLSLPRIGQVMPLAEFISCNPGAVLADPGGRGPKTGDRALIVGPEGGFSADELILAPSVALPGNVLRAETAALVAGAIACGLRSGLLASSEY